MFPVGAAKFIDFEPARHGHRPDREIGGPARLHADDDAVVEGGARAEAAFLIVADEHELREAALLKTREDVAANPHPLLFKRRHPRGEQVAGEGITLRQLEFDVIERDLAGLPRIRRRPVRGDWRGSGGLLRRPWRRGTVRRRHAPTAGDE